MTGKDLNKSPLSQTCLKALQALGVPADPQSVYSLQLVEWALENLDLNGPWVTFQSSILEQVQGMYEWKDPEKWLLDAEGNPPEATSPETLAQTLVENLFEHMQEVLPNLRTNPF